MSSVTFTQEERYVVVFETGDRAGIPALLFYVADFLKNFDCRRLASVRDRNLNMLGVI